MPGFKGKRKGGLTLTLYKKPFRYRLPVSPPRKRTKTSSSTPNLKSPSIRAPSLLKNLFQFQNIYILSNGFPHLFGVEDPVKMSLSFFGPDTVADLEGAYGACAPPKIRKAYIIQR